MNINIEVTIDEQKRIEAAAEFEKLTVEEFVVNWIRNGVLACEDDYILHDGKVVGDERDVEALEREVLS